MYSRRANTAGRLRSRLSPRGGDTRGSKGFISGQGQRALPRAKAPVCLLASCLPRESGTAPRTDGRTDGWRRPLWGGEEGESSGGRGKDGCPGILADAEHQHGILHGRRAVPERAGTRGSGQWVPAARRWMGAPLPQHPPALRTRFLSPPDCRWPCLPPTGAHYLI